MKEDVWELLNNLTRARECDDRNIWVQLKYTLIMLNY